MATDKRKNNSPADPTILQAATIKKLHGMLLIELQEYCEVLNVDVIDQIRTTNREEWVGTEAGEISLDLIRPSYPREMATRRGRSVPVFRLKGFQDVWISWHETWIVPQKKQFVLKGVSLAFWAGDQGQAEKRPIIRAEWDAFDSKHIPLQNSHAQPHWQVDHAVGFYVTPTVTTAPDRPAKIETDGLVELAPITTGLEETSGTAIEDDLQQRGSAISDYHLCMRADWTTAPKKPSWQASIDENSLPGWVRLCLDHMSQQLKQYGVKPYKE